MMYDGSGEWDVQGRRPGGFQATGPTDMGIPAWSPLVLATLPTAGVYHAACAGSEEVHASTFRHPKLLRMVSAGRTVKLDNRLSLI